MYCRNCGKQIENKAVVCVHCGVPPMSEKKFCNNCGADTQPNQTTCTSCGVALSTSQDIPNYLVPAILVTLFCCLPLGIPAIVYAAQVSNKIQRGDLQGAMRSSKNAKIFAWWSFGVGLAGSIIYIIFLLVGMLAGY